MSAEKKGITRRNFVGLMAGSAAALAAAGAAGAAGTVEPANMAQRPVDMSVPRVLPPWVREIDKPTYSKFITGTVGQMDQRIVATNLAKYKVGDGLFEKIFKEYPELLPAWETMAPERDPDPVKAQRAGVSMSGYMISRITVSPTIWLGLPDAVVPKPNASQMAVDPGDMSIRLKELGRLMGAADVRMGAFNPNWSYSILSGDPTVTGKFPDYWGQKNTINYKNIIVIAVPEDIDYLVDGDGPRANSRTLWAYTHGANMAVVLTQYIAKHGYAARAHHVSEFQIPLTPYAVDVGLAELGRIGFAVNPFLGAHFRLSAVTTDMPLAYDKPIDFGLQDFCENCKICADACPVGAIDKGPRHICTDIVKDGPHALGGLSRWVTDNIKCRTYWATNGISCSICMTACPWSKPDNWIHNAIRPIAALGGQPVGTALAQMERTFYGPYTKEPDASWVK
jgi:reductive dehalogenase